MQFYYIGFVALFLCKLNQQQQHQQLQQLSQMQITIMQ